MRRPALLDANLPLLYVVGLVNPAYIPLHRSLRAYRVEDLGLLLGLLQDASGIVLTSNTLTETGNLLDRISDPRKQHELSQALRAIVLRDGERYVASAAAVDQPEWDKLGLTDAVLLVLGAELSVLLTADLGLYLAASRAGYEAVNFNYVRGLG